MQLQQPDSLSDGSITLRPFDERDLAALELALRDPEIERWFGRSSFSAEEFLERKRRGWLEGTSASFAICDANEVDTCGGQVFMEPDEDRRAGVGYWLLPSARGFGRATRAVRLLSDWAFTQPGIGYLFIWAEPENGASLRVAERAGFRREGLLRAYIERAGARRDAVYYSLLPEDPRRPGRERPRPADMATVHILCGVVGAGKTTVARRIEEETGAVRFTLDEWALRLGGLGVEDPAYGFHAIRARHLIYAESLEPIRAGRSVIFDWSHFSRQQRRESREHAELLGAQFVCHYVATSIEQAAEWLERRNENIPYESRLTDIEGMRRLSLAFFEPPSPDEGFEIVIEHPSVFVSGAEARLDEADTST